MSRQLSAILGRALMLLGSLALAWCCWVAVDSWLFQQSARHQLEQKLTTRPDHKAQDSRRAKILRRGDIIGRLEIPRLNLSVVAIEGDSNRELLSGIGHIPGTASPGQTGNAGFAAHRDTFFRPLRLIRRGDLIRLVTSDGEFQYTVAGTEIVKPTQVKVLQSHGRQELTLVTCYPFFFIGTAPERFIVHGVAVPQAQPR